MRSFQQFQNYQIEKMSLGRKSSICEQQEVGRAVCEESSQDWVCVQCNNLNFSFRKKCNRCKVQSREDNHHMVYADYFYYNHYYQYQPAEQQKTLPALPLSAVNPNRTEAKSSMTKQFSSQQQIREQQSDHLPSVSSLLKKYKDSQAKKNAQSAKNTNRSELVWNLFGEQIWNNGQFESIGSLLGLKEAVSTDDEQASLQFAKSVEKVII